MTVNILGTPTKTYDGTVDTTLNAFDFSLANLVGSEGFTVTQTAGTYNSAHVLAANRVTAALSSYDFTADAGTLASDYALPAIASGTGKITAAVVAAGIVGDPTKAYDGSAGATLSPSNFTLFNLVGTESFTVTQAAGTYNSSHVLEANSVTAGLGAGSFTPIGNTLVSDYALPTSATGDGHVTARVVTAGIIGTPTKTYDGNTTASLSTANFSLANLVGGEHFTVTQTAGTYNNSHVASASSVTATLAAGDFTAVGGTLASDYSLPASATGAGKITARAVTAGIIGTPTKIYDGTTASALSPSNFSLSNLVGTESFTVTQTAGTYNSTHVLTASSVTRQLSRPATSRRARGLWPATTPCRPPPAVPARSRLGR